MCDSYFPSDLLIIIVIIVMMLFASITIFLLMCFQSMKNHGTAEIFFQTYLSLEIVSKNSLKNNYNCCCSHSCKMLIFKILVVNILWSHDDMSLVNLASKVSDQLRAAMLTDWVLPSITNTTPGPCSADQQAWTKAHSYRTLLLLTQYYAHWHDIVSYA